MEGHAASQMKHLDRFRSPNIMDSRNARAGE